MKNKYIDIGGIGGIQELHFDFNDIANIVNG